LYSDSIRDDIILTKNSTRSEVGSVRKDYASRLLMSNKVNG
jgi:hypothetical protein